MSKRQLRKDYQLAMQRVNELHAALELVDYHLEANESGPEQHRYMLFNEKQTLLTELDRFAIYIRTEEERVRYFYEGIESCDEGGFICISWHCQSL